MRRSAWAAAAVALAVAGGGTAFAVQARQDAVRAAAEARAATGGDPARAPSAIRQAGCGSCHTIPGLRDARGTVGPPLDRMGSRSFIAGVLANTPENMVLWLRWPQGFLPQSAMPNMGLDEAQARDIAAYLVTLK